MYDHLTLSEAEVVSLVGQADVYFNAYDNLLKNLRIKWQDIFDATYVFKNNYRNGDGKSKMFFAKCFEHIEKFYPKITAKNPKYVVQPLLPADLTSAPKALQERPDIIFESAYATQRWLDWSWTIARNNKKAREWCKSACLYGVGFAEAKISRIYNTSTSIEQNDGEEVETTARTVVAEYADIEPYDIFDCYWDPRISSIEDMPAFIHVKTVNMYDLEEYSSEYIEGSVAKLKDNIVATTSESNDNAKANIDESLEIPNIQESNNPKVVLRTYYGWFRLVDDQPSRLLKLVIANGTTILCCKRIDVIPVEMFNVIDVPRKSVSIGVVEPIKDLQEAYNLTRNQRFENVNLVMAKMFLMRRGAAIDPRKLKSTPGNVIQVSDINNDLKVLDTRDVTASSYQEVNSLNTEMQAINNTIDATQDASSNGFTNLATGQKIRYKQFNEKIDSIIQNYEDALASLGRKHLLLAAKELTVTPKIPGEDGAGFLEIAKEVFTDYTAFYNVQVSSNSTAYDSLENSRDQALAVAQISLEYKDRGVPIDLGKVYSSIMATFPGINPEQFIDTNATAPSPVGGGSQGRLPQGVVNNAAIPQEDPNNLTIA